MQCEIFHRHQGINKNQRRTTLVIGLTVVMMAAEISAGMIFGSIALLSDGIHMGTHALALLITLAAYVIARRNAVNANFSFGTGKVGVLGGYSSALVLIIAALVMVWEAINRLIEPEVIQFDQSIIVAITGLVVNVISAFLLQDSHDHSHGHDHGHHHHEYEDHNLKAAYLHVLADALTSVLAIAALLIGKYSGAIWLDPVIGIVGAAVVIKWGVGLLRSTGAILLDYESHSELGAQVQKIVQADGASSLTDLHIWRVSSGQRALLCSVSGTCSDSGYDRIRKDLNNTGQFSHVTVEFV